MDVVGPRRRMSLDRWDECRMDEHQLDEFWGWRVEFAGVPGVSTRTLKSLLALLREQTQAERPAGTPGARRRLRMF